MEVSGRETWTCWKYGVFSLGLPLEVVEFIYTHCKCAHCGGAITKDLSRCKCCGARNTHRMEVMCHGEAVCNMFQKMIRREELRMMSRHRHSQVKRNGGSFTKNDVADLFKVQEGLCYFCGEQISIGKGNNRLHADHYAPIAYGGKNDVFNIVLTCPSCNITKGAMHGDHFEQIARKARNPDNGRKLGLIRRKLNRYRAQRRAAT